MLPRPAPTCDWCGLAVPAGLRAVRLTVDSQVVLGLGLCLGCKDELLGRAGVAAVEAREARERLLARPPVVLLGAVRAGDVA